MKKIKIKCKVLNALNQPFLGWMIPSIIIGLLGAGFYKDCNKHWSNDERCEVLKIEINKRINIAKEYSQACKMNIINNWSDRATIDTIYSKVITNPFLASPRAEYFDSLEYNIELKDKSLPVLLIEFKNNSKNKDIADSNYTTLKKLKSYYDYHPRADSGSFGDFMKMILSLNEITKH